MLSQAHYSPQNINDAFSKKVFKKFINELDQEKNMYLQTDMAELKKYETKIDDEIKGSPVEFFLAAGKTFNARMEEASVMCKEILAKPFDFTIDEDVILDGDKT
jgi:carboxyl-terminal processing protease